MEAALGPGRALEGVAPVHEGTLAHACAPSLLNWWQPAGPLLQVLPVAFRRLDRVRSQQSSSCCGLQSSRPAHGQSKSTLTVPMQKPLCTAMTCVLAYPWHCRQDALKQCMPSRCIIDRQIDGRMVRQIDRQAGRQAGRLLKRDMDDAILHRCRIREVDVTLSQCLLKVVA